MKRILTGDTPTGRLHLGHYVGTLENRVKLQRDYEMFILFADTHALTTLSSSPKLISGYTREVLLDNLSVGLDPKSVTFFVESAIPEIYELAAIFSMYVSHNRALRNPTIKEEIVSKGLGDRFSLGFINYPIYQAADILCVKGQVVPVGKDQEAHLEQTREIVREFNRLTGSEIFPEPQALIGRVGKLIGTDGNPKMGKSLNNTIYLSDPPEEVEKRVMNMYTDPKRIHPTDPGTVDGNPVFIYLDTFATQKDRKQTEDYKNKYKKGEVGDVEVKKFLTKVLNEFLKPIRDKRLKYEKDPDLLNSILEDGNAKTKKITSETLQELKQKLGLGSLI